MTHKTVPVEPTPGLKRHALEAAQRLSRYAAAPFFPDVEKRGIVRQTSAEWWDRLANEIEEAQPLIHRALMEMAAPPSPVTELEHEMTQQNLPELPEPFALSVSVREDKMVECMLYQTHPTEKQKLYTAAQMHAYALAALSSQGAGEAAQPARVVDERDAALNLIMKMCNDAKEPCSTDPESAGAIRNGKFASIAGVAAQGLGLIRGPSLSTPPAAPTTSQAGVVTELEDVKRWFMNQETGMLVQTERGPWVRYVDVLAAFEAKKAGQA